MRLNWNPTKRKTNNSNQTGSPDLSRDPSGFCTKKGGAGYLLAATLGTLLTLPLAAQLPTSSILPPLDPVEGISTLSLYPHGAPEAKGTADADTPILTVFRPVHPNGTAIIVAPGGGYVNLASNHEGRQVADRLAEWGITAFVLRYRLGSAYPYPIPLNDARQAIRLVRSLAPTYGYSPDRIGMLGFSAGGHLTAAAATLPQPGDPAATDPVATQSSALNFSVLIYPWLNAMEPQVQGPKGPMINYCSLVKGLTQADCIRLDPQYTPAKHVTATTPPTFIAATTTDATVPVTTSVAFYSALHAAGADAELHLFAKGPHGFGTGGADPVLSQWPDLLENWLRAHGWLTPPNAKP